MMICLVYPAAVRNFELILLVSTLRKIKLIIKYTYRLIFIKQRLFFEINFTNYIYYIYFNKYNLKKKNLKYKKKNIFVKIACFKFFRILENII